MAEYRSSIATVAYDTDQKTSTTITIMVNTVYSMSGQWPLMNE